MNIYPLVDIDNDWIPKYLFETFQKYSNIRFVKVPEQADLIWILSHYILWDSLLPISVPEKILYRLQVDKLLPHSRWQQLMKLKQHYITQRRSSLIQIPIIGSYHHLVPEKEYHFLDTIQRLDAICDAIHCYAEINIKPNQHYFSKPIFHRPYWIDLNDFFPLNNKTTLRQRWNIPSDKIVIGSFQRDTERSGKPKLEKGPDVLCDVLEQLDPEQYFVLLSGVRRGYVEGRLQSMGMPYRNLGFVAREEMNALYNTLDYYLVTSRYEGGPQAILECMATNIPIYSTPVGIAHSLSPSVICHTTADFVAALETPYPAILDRHRQTVQNDYAVEVVIPQYETAFAEIIATYSNVSPFYDHTPNISWHYPTKQESQYST